MFTLLKASRVHWVLYKPCRVAGFWVFNNTITSIRCISIENEYHSHRYNSSANISKWYIKNWPHSQKRKIKVNDQITKIKGIRTSIRFGFGWDCDWKKSGNLCLIKLSCYKHCIHITNSVINKNRVQQIVESDHKNRLKIGWVCWWIYIKLNKLILD